MATLTISIIVVFVLGYALIATESLTKVNKAAIALLMLVGCWTLYMMDPMQYLQLMHPDYTGGAAGMVEKVTGIIQEHLGDTATTLFFLMGAMTIVEIVDQNGGFNWVRKVMKTKSKRALLWRIAILTFFLSAILDNLTTSIVMIMILRKLVTDHKDRMVYASLVIIAANSGGAFSPIGDVTTIMLWNKGLITAAGVIAEIFIPSVVSLVIPALILQTMLKGELVMPEVSAQQNASVSDFTEGQRKAVFWLGVGGLIFVPIFKSITHLPPFVGILLVLGVLWTATEVFYRGLHRGADAEGTQKRVTKLLVGGRNFTALASQSLTLKELGSYPLISLSEESMTRSFYRQFFLDHGAVLKPDTEAATTDQMLTLVKSELGLAFLPQPMAGEPLARGEIVQLHLQEIIPQRSVCLVYDHHRPLNTAARKFQQMLTKTLPKHA